MDQQVLLIAFAIFTVIILGVALVLRSKSVDDIFSDKSPSFSMPSLPVSDMAQKTVSQKNVSVPRNTSIGADRPAFELNRQNINKLGKILGAIGAVMIVAPLPSNLDGLSFGIAFVGYILARFSNPPRDQKKATVQSPSVTTLRQLASKPEYREAIQLLSADMANKNLQSDLARQRRAIQYLQSKGVSEQDATRNMAILAKYVAQQVKK